MPEILVTATGDQWSPLQNESEFQINELQKIIIELALNYGSTVNSTVISVGANCVRPPNYGKTINLISVLYM